MLWSIMFVWTQTGFDLAANLEYVCDCPLTYIEMTVKYSFIHKSEK